MKFAVLVAFCLLAGCTQERVEKALQFTEDGCRAYLDFHPEDTGKFAEACRALLLVAPLAGQ